MLGFIKKCFFTGLEFLPILTSVKSLICISMNNQDCKVKPQIVSVNSDDPVFFPFVPDIAKSLNVRAFNLMSRTNETRHIE